MDPLMDHHDQQPSAFHGKVPGFPSRQVQKPVGLTWGATNVDSN